MECLDCGHRVDSIISNSNYTRLYCSECTTKRILPTILEKTLLRIVKKDRDTMSNSRKNFFLKVIQSI